jgi:hypothetical protein
MISPVSQDVGGRKAFLLRRKLGRLSPEQRRELNAMHQRHLRACERAGIAPDPLWLPEAIEDLSKGRKL